VQLTLQKKGPKETGQLAQTQSHGSQEVTLGISLNRVYWQ